MMQGLVFEMVLSGTKNIVVLLPQERFVGCKFRFTLAAGYRRRC